jgi:pimeloyl-ACP methyl ester carboxylesterase
VTLAMQPIDIPVRDGSLRALRFGNGPRIVLAAHGLTASAMSFRAVARHLPAEWSLVALDLRGRVGSAGMPGPYGMAAHAADLVAATEHLGPPLVLTGQSMGAYAALRAAATRPAPCRHRPRSSRADRYRGRRRPYQAVRSAHRGGPAAGPLPRRVGRRRTGGQQARCAATRCC